MLCNKFVFLDALVQGSEGCGPYYFAEDSNTTWLKFFPYYNLKITISLP